MSSCVMPSPLPVPTGPLCSRKRPLSSTEDAMSINRILKAHKRSSNDSPRALTVDVAIECTEPVSIRFAAEWPKVTATETVQQAMAFLRDSRQHALVLLAQNEWHRALSVLDKVERANDIVSRQRRKVVLNQVNAVKYADACEETPRKVRFHEEVTVAIAADVDRTPVKVPGFVKEEILILRASRPIPKENYSEFWN